MQGKAAKVVCVGKCGVYAGGVAAVQRRYKQVVRDRQGSKVAWAGRQAESMGTWQHEKAAAKAWQWHVLLAAGRRRVGMLQARCEPNMSQYDCHMRQTQNDEKTQRACRA